MVHAFVLTLAVIHPEKAKHSALCETSVRSSQTVSVDINRQNGVFLSGENVGLAAIHRDFIALAKRYPHAFVSVEADAKASYGTVLQVVDAAKSAGLAVGLSP